MQTLNSKVILIWSPTLNTYPEIIRNFIWLMRQIKYIFGIFLFSIVMIGFFHILDKIIGIFYFIGFSLLCFEYLEVIETNNDFILSLYLLRVLYQFSIMIIIPVYYLIQNNTIDSNEIICNTVYYSILASHNIIMIIYLLIYSYKNYKTKLTNNLQNNHDVELA
jgi:hypothetical protein